MTNQLFIICPFSSMEIFLQRIYGKDIFFLTYSGAVFQPGEIEYNSEICDFILREKISEIFVVNDTSCRFIDSIVSMKKTMGFASEKVIESIYIDHYFSHFKDAPLSKQKFLLAELNVKAQMKEIINSSIIGPIISDLDIDVKGLITSKQFGACIEISTVKTSLINGQ